MDIRSNICSPESTVTALLASSGYLKSTLSNDVDSAVIMFKDKKYESATEALNAYIEDFEQSCDASVKSPGKLKLSRSSSNNSNRFGLHMKNKDVLKGSLSNKELSMLDLPVGQPFPRNSDLVSLTTDDLLALPPDGSLPVTRTSAALSRSDRLRSLDFSSFSTTYRKPTSLNASRFSSKDLELPEVRLPSQRNRIHATKNNFEDFDQKHSTFRKYMDVTDLHLKHTVSAPSTLTNHKQSEPELPTCTFNNYPRWLTSWKSEMDFSGISSLPDTKYPLWLRECDLASEASGNTESNKQVMEDVTLDKNNHFKLYSDWQNNQQKEVWDNVHQDNLNNLLNCARETIKKSNGLLTPKHVSVLGKGQLDMTTQNGRIRSPFEFERRNGFAEPFQDHEMNLLMHKAEKSRSVRQSCNIKENVSIQTEDVLDADRSWDNPPIIFNPPVPVDGEEELELERRGKTKLIENYLTDCINSTNEAVCSNFSGGSFRKHHGPVETLKHMMFSLQSVEQCFNSEQTHLQEMSDKLDLEKPLENFETAAGSQSLQRALHHLVRLKNLVDDMNEKKDLDSVIHNGIHVNSDGK
ncbi:LAS2 protein, partial [Polypterus senegalus]